MADDGNERIDCPCIQRDFCEPMAVLRMDLLIAARHM